MTEYPKFSDFATDDKKLDGGKVKLKDILNQELIVLNYAIHRSKIASHAERLGIHNPLEDVVRRSSW